MADVRPFAGFRFDPRQVSLSRALCPPYDVIDSQQARHLRRDPYNAIHLELPAGSGAWKYRRAANLWRRWLREGRLRRDCQPSFYICEQRFKFGGDTRRRLGFLAALGVGPKAARAVLPHERTLPKPKADRLKLLRAVKANISPIFGIFPDSGGRVRRALKAAVKETAAAVGLTKAGARYRLWRLSDPRVIRTVQRVFGPKQILIADGHHRYEVSREYFRRTKSSGAETVLAYLCPEEDPGLLVLPTHRVVRSEIISNAVGFCRLYPCVTRRELLKRLSRAKNPYAFGLYRGSYLLAVPRAAGGCRSGLCVEWLGRRLLAHVPPDQISYTPDADKAVRLAREISGTAVFVKPLQVGQIRRAVRAIGLLPPKSTYFYPKIGTGLVFKGLK